MKLKRVFITGLMAVCAMGGTAFGMLVGQVASPSTQIKPEWTIDLRTVCVVGSIVIPGVWLLSKFATRLVDGMHALGIRLTSLEVKVDNLPCHGNSKSPCPAHPPIEVSD